jgi:hypothetical protein
MLCSLDHLLEDARPFIVRDVLHPPTCRVRRAYTPTMSRWKGARLQRNDMQPPKRLSKECVQTSEEESTSLGPGKALRI